ncbi:MAG: SDR family oxidoreductase [Cyclobacteriaceae bacterium]
MNTLKSQTAIVTGASSGIGHAVAEMMLKEGMNVVITARTESKLQALRSDYQKCEILAGNVLDEKLPQQLIDLATEKFGGVDVVFNNAGVMHTASIENTDIDEMCEMIRVNLEAGVRMAYTSLKYFKFKKKGHLVNVSSVLGTKVRPTTGIYAATKYGIEALSEALRMEVANSDVKVSVIEPGATKTNLQDHFEKHPLQVLGIEKPILPEDIARCVKFILEQPDHVRIPVMMIMPGEQAM